MSIVRDLARFCDWLATRLGFWRIDVVLNLARAKELDSLAAELDAAGLHRSAGEARASAARWRGWARDKIPARAPEKWRAACSA